MASTPLPTSARPAASSDRGWCESFAWRRVPRPVLAASLLAVLGVTAVWPTALQLWSLWLTDPLKSIGALVPWVSLWLVLRAWRALGWRSHGSWWGVALVALVVLLSQLRAAAVLELVVAPGWSTELLPVSLLAALYAAGWVLAVGGSALWRVTLFPVALMLLVNPVPHLFTSRVDVPLQHASALVARGLAHALGQPLTPDQLTLMFTPQFGMFIAPGCDGLRGAVTMALLALVAGYLYRFRRGVWAVAVVGGLLLGYLFNLVRLCALVVFYVVALHWPVLQAHAEGADYLLGATLFFIAATLLFAATRRWGPSDDLRLPSLPLIAQGGSRSGDARSLRWREMALVGLLALGATPLLVAGHDKEGASGRVEARFPAQLGPYRRTRQWTERLDTGVPIFAWAAYAAEGQTGEIEVGVSPVLGAHDTLLCHSARGEAWQWQGATQLETRTGRVALAGALFRQGAVDALELSTLCTAGVCGQWTGIRQHPGLVYSRPAWPGLAGAARPVPVLLRAEGLARGLSVEESRSQLLERVQSFAANTSFGAFTGQTVQP